MLTKALPGKDPVVLFYLMGMAAFILLLYSRKNSAISGNC
jgi:hypothetical protein